jgi:hypothetical protein
LKLTAEVRQAVGPRRIPFTLWITERWSVQEAPPLLVSSPPNGKSDRGNSALIRLRHLLPQEKGKEERKIGVKGSKSILCFLCIFAAKSFLRLSLVLENNFRKSSFFADSGAPQEKPE